MAKTFLFYDLETSGLDKAFDQVQQFAAIRTDLELNEIERHEIFLRINPDVIPSPEAVLVHRVDVDLCEKIGLCEYDGIKQIHHLLNTPQTISVGYNTLGFDDEFLRFSFYRNLLSPYTHQYANGCCRADLFPITALFRWSNSDCLQWPERNGQSSLKLELINKVNHLAQGQAHNALVDVEATIALARSLKQHDSKWNYAIEFFDKNQEKKRLQNLQNPDQYPTLPPIALLIDGCFGPKNHYQAPALFLGYHQHYRNQSLWLRLDDAHLTSNNEATLFENAKIIRKKQAESPFFMPYQPRFTQNLSAENQAIVAKNLAWLSNQTSLLSQLQEKVLNNIYPEIDHLALEASLYQNPFPNQKTTKALYNFHQHTSDHQYSFMQQLPEPYKSLALKLMVRNFPEQCSNEDKAIFHSHCQEVFHGRINHQNKTSRSLEATINYLNQLDHASLDAQQKQLMITLKDHLLQKQPPCEVN